MRDKITQGLKDMEEGKVNSLEEYKDKYCRIDTMNIIIHYKGRDDLQIRPRRLV